MTVVADIRCPDCDRHSTVVKVAIDRYRCEDCDREFSHGAVLPD